jgi:hypothetical protein
MNYIAAALVVVFTALSLVHFYWALGGSSGKLGAVPEQSGRKAFEPSVGATFIVAVGLALCGALVAATAGLIRIPSSGDWPQRLSYVLALALFARAVGDFRLVGFFKRVRGTRFALLDSLVYAPLCLLLSIGVYCVASGHGG